MAALAVVRSAVHRIRYWAGSEVTSDGPPRYDFVGRLIESTGYFFSACRSCGEFSARNVAERFVAGIIESESWPGRHGDPASSAGAATAASPERWPAHAAVPTRPEW